MGKNAIDIFTFAQLFLHENLTKRSDDSTVANLEVIKEFLGAVSSRQLPVTQYYHVGDISTMMIIFSLRKSFMPSFF